MTYALVFFETEADHAQREGEEAGAYWGAWSRYIDLLADSNVMILGAGRGLEPPTTARTVRLRDGKRVVQDGPLPDTKEQLAGIVFIEVEDLSAALHWAEQAPCASTSGVEVRPVLAPPSA